jgi:chaperonin cofactor prefoldin
VREAKAGASADGALAGRFVLVRRGQEAAMPAELAKRRDAIESRIAALRSTKAELNEKEYFEQLEAMLIELANCYDEAEADAASMR